MRYSLSTDAAYIRSVMTHPRIWPHIAEHGLGDPETFTPQFADGLLYLRVDDGFEPLGLFVLERVGAIEWSVHTCLLPSAWGRATEAAQGLLVWLWLTIPECRRLTTRVPAHNRLALRLARRAGLIEYGRNPQSFLFADGRLADQILLGISRAEE